MRYQRHIQLKEIGIEGQEKIRRAKILVVGAGGLGCPALQYLTAAGIGTLGIMDPDVVSISNLQRQILFTESDLGSNKALSAKKQLQKLNSEVSIQAFHHALTPENAAAILSEFDLVIDGTDNFFTRYLLNDQCILLNKVMVYGALFKFEGQVSVFNYKNGPSYRCLFPTPPERGAIPNCSEIGVLGVVPGIIGVYQATEALKVILDLGDILSGKLLTLNLLTHQNTLLNFEKEEEQIQKIKTYGKPIPIENIDCFLDFEVSLSQLSSEEKIKWIDVREPDEVPQVSRLNPLNYSTSLDALLAVDTKIVAFCQSGMRSKVFVQQLKNKGVENCFSLKEGAEALEKWSQKSQR
jgi:molybdopterin/thiamine biosynthesis adenylyltransferase/rhodanese-related sulfurtransferase